MMLKQCRECRGTGIDHPASAKSRNTDDDSCPVCGGSGTVGLFTLEDAQAAADEWGFNCGPAALCAVLGKTPDEIRPHMRDFEQKRYTSPSMMRAILDGLGVPFTRVYESADEGNHTYPDFGLVRLQWGGPWTRPGVPIRARYRHTHWVAVRPSKGSAIEVFDVNAMCVGGWMSYEEWSLQLVPWLIRETTPKGDGTWWPTHCWELPHG